VTDYLAGLPARLPPAGGAAVPALVQFRAGLDADAAAGLLTGAGPGRVSSGAVAPDGVSSGAVAPDTAIPDTAIPDTAIPDTAIPDTAILDTAILDTAVFRVALPRVQTALRFAPLPPVDAPDPAAVTGRRFALAQRDARRDAAEAAGRLTGRVGQVARYEAAALASTSCRCVLAVLVVGDRAALTRLAGLPEVRAVDAAPEGTPPTGVALSPLLPEQIHVAGPVPDDGPVPPTAPG
jgi:hypothetical protein